MKNALYNYYQKEVIPQLTASMTKRNGKAPNVMEIPKLVKIVLSTGVRSDKDKEVMTVAADTLSTVTGQKAVICKSTKNISNFKLRKGMAVGSCVTLRRDSMWNYLYRLINIVLPRVRDFRGVSPKSFDGVGNYNFGLSEQSVYPEIDLDKVKHTIGMNICIVTTAKNDADAKELLALLGMPFADRNTEGK